MFDRFAEQLRQGEEYFGSGTVNSGKFNHFYRNFKKEFHNALRFRGCTNITFSKGHFYLSGFFTYKGQPYYFSISDVRSTIGEPQLLYRTAESYTDYRGGMNQYVKIGNDMEDKMNLKPKS